MKGLALTALGIVGGKPETKKRLGSMRCALALGCADVGRVELESGLHVHITWGRNLNKKEQEWFLANTAFQPIWVGADDGSAELIIPADEAARLLPSLVARGQ